MSDVRINGTLEIKVEKKSFQSFEDGLFSI